jgi:Amt family ammonium transporter
VAITFGVVLALSLVTFAAIKAIIGVRVSEEVEAAGLDITEHGMYGYPEQFIPAPELEGYGALSTRPAAAGGPAGSYQPTEVPA